MVYIHTAFFIYPSVSAKNRPDLLLRKPGRFDCVICEFPVCFTPSPQDLLQIFFLQIEFRQFCLVI